MKKGKFYVIVYQKPETKLRKGKNLKEVFMKLNKLLALLIAVAMIFAFTACDNAANSTPTPDNGNQVENQDQGNQNQNNQDNTTNEDTGDEEDPEIVAPDEGETTETEEAVMKVFYANLPPEGQTWDQPGKFQFALANFEVAANDVISIMILPLERAELSTSLMRKNGDGYDKWLPTTSTLITEGEWAGWYEMSCTATCSSSGVMFTFYNKAGQEFQPGEDSSIAWPVYVAQVTVNGTVVPLDEIDATRALCADIDYEVIHEIPVSRLEANLAAAGVTSGDSTDTPAEGTGDGTSTETPAEGDAGASNGEAASTEGAAE